MTLAARGGNFMIPHVMCTYLMLTMYDEIISWSWALDSSEYVASKVLDSAPITCRERYEKWFKTYC